MTKAVQISASDGDGGSIHTVGVGDLKVMIICEAEQVWYAQGLEIDYLAQGVSLDDVKASFEIGLKKTIDAHLQHYGDIKKLLKPAPLEAWTEFYEHATSDEHVFSQVTAHHSSVPTDDLFLYATYPSEEMDAKPTSSPKKLPFKRIAYLEPALAAC